MRQSDAAGIAATFDADPSASSDRYAPSHASQPMYRAMLFIDTDRFACAFGRQILRGITLPSLILATDLCDCDRAVTSGKRPECGSSFDGDALRNSS